jgi:hypothetical protein
MKYLEELSHGDCFSFNGSNYITTTDFKKNGAKLAVNLSTGQSNWIESDSIVENIDIFTLDKDSNVIAMKERSSDDTNSNTNLY